MMGRTGSDADGPTDAGPTITGPTNTDPANTAPANGQAGDDSNAAQQETNP